MEGSGRVVARYTSEFSPLRGRTSSIIIVIFIVIIIVVVTTTTVIVVIVVNTITITILVVVIIIATPRYCPRLPFALHVLRQHRLPSTESLPPPYEQLRIRLRVLRAVCQASRIQSFTSPCTSC